jgi:pyruvate/2-oxoglutarate dehydrogenase complex dihydrolipoamide acyltransferase (E2) component
LQVSFVHHLFIPISAQNIKVPTMGDSISEGVIEEFVKNAGDFVEADEIIARIETDKVTVDITASTAGVIGQYFAGVGDTVEVGADFYTIDPDAKGSSTPAAPKAATPAAPTPAAEAPKQVSKFVLPLAAY